MLNLWKKNKIMFIFLLIIAFLIPTSLAKDSDFSTHFICVGLGIDKNGDEYELSAQVIVPEQKSAFTQKLQVYSAKGTTFQECTDNLNMHVGKLPGLAHCAYLVVNEEMLNGDIIPAIDFLIREFKIGTNSVILATDKSSKEILVLSSALNNNQGIDVQTLLDYNNTYLFSRDPNIESIYSATLGGSPNYLISIFSTSSEDTDGVNTKGSVEMQEESSSQNSSSGASGGNQNGSSGDSGQKSSGDKKDSVLVNSGELVLMNKANKIGKVDYKDVYAIRYINPKNKIFNFKVENFSDDFFQNASIEVSSDRKLQQNTYAMQKGRPVLTLNITQFMSITGVVQSEYKNADYVANKNRFSPKLCQVLEDKIKGEIEKSFEIMQNYSCDFMRLYDSFLKVDYKGFNEFLDSLENKQDYVKHIELKINLKIMPFDE